MGMQNTEGLVKIVEHVAAEQVPGSTLRILVNGETHLFEIGNDMKGGERAPIPYDPKTIASTTFGHAHADHVGRTLDLIAGGFSGRFYATHQTAAIARLQFEQDVRGVQIYNNMIRGKRITSGPKRGEYIPYKEVKYTLSDVVHAMDMFAAHNDSGAGFPFGTEVEIGEGVSVKFFQAGHIPGAAQTRYKIKRKGREVNILFAYDLGRTDYKILNHPVANIPLVRFPDTNFGENIDYIVIEATYGNKVHRPLEESLSVLEKAASDAAKKCGMLVIPAFSIMRTQMLWNFLFHLEQKGKLPRQMKFYSSSPMADDVAKIMLSHKQDLNERAIREFMIRNDNPFFFNKLVHHNKYADTKRIMQDSKGYTPIGIIASSGMCDQGRVVGILREVISNPNNIILMTGYAAPGTRADMLIAGKKIIPFPEGAVELRAEVRRMGGLSGHADSVEMLAHLRNLHDPAKGGQFKGIFIKHGEKEACYALRDEIVKAGYDPATVVVMKKGEEYALK